MTNVSINTATGTSPFQIWLSNGCGANATQTYVGQITSADIPYTFNITQQYQNSPFCVKVIDSDNCEVCDCFGFGPSPTPDATPTVTPTVTVSPTQTPTPTTSGVCPTPTYYYGSFTGNGFTSSATYTLSATLYNGRAQWVSPSNGTIRWDGIRWSVSQYNLGGTTYYNPNMTLDSPDTINWVFQGCANGFVCSVLFTTSGCGLPSPTPTQTATPPVTPTLTPTKTSPI